jgi:hypothetical protein
MGRCRVPREEACGCLPLKTAVRMILFDKKTPLDRTSFNGSINGTLFWLSLYFQVRPKRSAPNGTELKPP